MIYVARDVIGLRTKNIPVPTSTVGLDLSTLSLSSYAALALLSVRADLKRAQGLRGLVEIELVCEISGDLAVLLRCAAAVVSECAPRCASKLREAVRTENIRKGKFPSAGLVESPFDIGGGGVLI